MSRWTVVELPRWYIYGRERRRRTRHDVNQCVFYNHLRIIMSIIYDDLISFSGFGLIIIP